MNEKFLREIGVEPAQSTSCNPLESPPALSDSVGWALGEEEFKRRVKTSEVSKTSEVWKAFKSAREETVSVTEEAVRVEREIDKRVKALYGL